MTVFFSTNSNLDDQNESYQSGNTKLAGQKTIVLGKFAVKDAFIDKVRIQVNEIQPHLLECEYYPTIELLGAEFLASLSSIERRLAVYCLQHLAEQNGSTLVDKNGCGLAATYMWTGNENRIN